MALSIRYFVFEENGTLGYLPRRVIADLVFDRDRLPQYARKRVRVAWVLVSNQGGAPNRLEGVGGELWSFDEVGHLVDDDEVRDALELVHFAKRPPIDSNVIDLTDRLRERRIAERRWEPTSKDISQIVHALWPESANHPVHSPLRITGLLKRKPPMTYDAKQAVSECWQPLFSIQHQIEKLSEPALKAFIAEMEEDDPSDPLYSALRQGAAMGARKQLEIKRAWKSGKGRWYAVAMLFTKREPGVDTVDELEVIACDGQPSAVKAAQELLIKYVNHFTATTEISAEIHPEAEWRPNQS